MSNKRIYSLKEIADNCSVDFKVLSTWFEKNNLSKSIVSVDDFVDFLNHGPNRLSSVSELLIEKEINALVIDSDINVVESISNVFTTKGIHSFSANNGFEAAVILSKFKPNIITLDLNLDTLGGFEVLRIIDRLNLKGKTWIVIISNESEENIACAINNGADFYLKKPFAKSDLEKIISKFYSKQIKNTELDLRRTRRAA
jgi:CheY-like chemotaxis protein